MSQIIAFVSPKGGSGATFACAGLWYSFAQKGKKVLAVDLCGKRASLDFALGFQNDSVYDVSDVVKGECSLEDALCSYEANPDACFLRAGTDEFDVSNLKSLLSDTTFEYILLDVANDERSFEMLFGADINIIVTDCNEVSVRMCDEYASRLEWDKSYIIINKIIPSYIENKIMPTVDEIIDGVGIRPIGLLPWHPKGMALFGNSLDDVFSDKNLAKAFENISLRLQGDNAPAIDFNTYYECFKIKKGR